MTKRIKLNFVEKNCPILDNPGLWTYPESEAHRHGDLSYWMELAVLLEQAKFDGIFLGDALGTFDTYKGGRDTAILEGISMPIHDPTYLIPAMASVTRHLGLAVTCSLTYDHPYALARKMSTLDHLTKGRIGWNIVTSNLDSAARNFGYDQQIEHDSRYDRGDEFLEVCYKLWEKSWEDGAVVRDIPNRMYTNPAKVHDIAHKGTYFQVPGIHLCEPSPQRTPVLFQAGSSHRGREFAAKHAECNFLNAVTVEETRYLIRDVRAKAEKYGREAGDILFFPRIVPVVGATDEEAQQKIDRYLQHLSTEGTLALLSSWTGIDLYGYTPERLYELIAGKSGGNGYITDYLRRAQQDKQWTMEELARLYAFGGLGNVIVGSPGRIADHMESFIQQTGADGFNLGYITRSESVTDFVHQVIPVLQRRGLVQSEYREGTYREKLFAHQAGLPRSHPGAQV
ncbi:LLM class flavin-dependent oxidoreductase [Paenibacillus eucommiae]|uniref:FMN-dependent oxidoreductase (Nitrilotriacetate monooxygenase family) n=1 Tax=Paenibacillus eucommiae TaxID=1355755 RepID=A0ABS4J984_9BACL|nr:LLM class flavin-dependent oxidoreductase [Paenibacillus eucommiae]MBP1996360.1 FMN-dependent oxidoreductase (nitrilotriacetate monooxygenase family) [Paenibacillus eucommiae]